MLTKLDIINSMLAATGTAPLTSNDTSHPFYVKANNKLTQVNREVQGRGWWFNRTERTLNPDISGHVILPSNTLHADPVDTAVKFVVRGTRLYDLKNATYELNTAVAVNFVDLVDIPDLPPTAGEYIRSRAVYEFYLDEDGNSLKVQQYMGAMQVSQADFKAEHLRNADVNWFNGASAASMRRGTRRQAMSSQ